MLKNLARVQLLILDDWAITPLNAEQRRDLMEIVDDRQDRAFTIVTSHVLVDRWHEHIGNPLSQTPCWTGCCTVHTGSN